MEFIAEPELKRTMMTSGETIPILNSFYRRGVTSLSSLPQRLSALSHGFTFPMFSPFFDTFNVIIIRMLDSGLGNFWFQRTFYPKGNIRKVDEMRPEVLTLEHLDVAFKIIMVAMAISCLSFLAEIVFFQVQKMFRK